MRDSCVRMIAASEVKDAALGCCGSLLEIAWSLVHLLSGRLAEQLERLDAMGYGDSQATRSEIMKKARNFDRIAAIVAGNN